MNPRCHENLRSYICGLGENGSVCGCVVGGTVPCCHCGLSANCSVIGFKVDKVKDECVDQFRICRHEEVQSS